MECNVKALDVRMTKDTIIIIKPWLNCSQPWEQ